VGASDVKNIDGASAMTIAMGNNNEDIATLLLTESKSNKESKATTSEVLVKQPFLHKYRKIPFESLEVKEEVHYSTTMQVSCFSFC